MTVPLSLIGTCWRKFVSLRWQRSPSVQRIRRLIMFFKLVFMAKIWCHDWSSFCFDFMLLLLNLYLDEVCMCSIWSWKIYLLLFSHLPLNYVFIFLILMIEIFDIFNFLSVLVLLSIHNLISMLSIVVTPAKYFIA